MFWDSSHSTYAQELSILETSIFIEIKEGFVGFYLWYLPLQNVSTLK